MLFEALRIVVVASPWVLTFWAAVFGFTAIAFMAHSMHKNETFGISFKMALTLVLLFGVCGAGAIMWAIPAAYALNLSR